MAIHCKTSIVKQVEQYICIGYLHVYQYFYFLMSVDTSLSLFHLVKYYYPSFIGFHILYKTHNCISLLNHDFCTGKYFTTI